MTFTSVVGIGDRGVIGRAKVAKAPHPPAPERLVGVPSFGSLVRLPAGNASQCLADKEDFFGAPELLTAPSALERQAAGIDVNTSAVNASTDNLPTMPTRSLFKASSPVSSVH
jgi:hypothetical protein